MAITVLHGCDQSGATTERPTNAPDGFAFFDTTFNCMIFYDETNAVWRDGGGRNVANGIYEMSGAGVPVDGTSGTGAAIAAKGCRYTRTTTGTDYVNIGTQASPVWSPDALPT